MSCLQKCTLQTSENRQESHLNLHHILTNSPGGHARLYNKRIETVLAAEVFFYWRWTPCTVGYQKMTRVPFSATKDPSLTYQQCRWADNDMPDRDWWRRGHNFDEACSRQLQSLSFYSCQTYKVSLCQPNGRQWDHAVFCLAFLLFFCAVLPRASLLSHMKTGS